MAVNMESNSSSYLSSSGLETLRSSFLPIQHDAVKFVLLGGLGLLWFIIPLTPLLRGFEKFWQRSRGYLRNDEGKSIPEFKAESRFYRFSHGYELSTKGAEIANRAPLLIWNGRVPEIILTQPEHVKDFYSRKSQEHRKPVNGNMGHLFGRIMGECLGVQNGQTWKTMRKAFEPHFSHKSAMAFVKTMNDQIDLWVKDLGAGNNEFAVETGAVTRVLPFKIIAIALYGEVMNDAMFAEVLELNQVHDRVLLATWFGKMQRNRLFNLLPTTTKKDTDDFITGWKDFNLRAIREAEARNVQCPVRDMYQSVVAGTISEAACLQSIDEILFANLDVTSAILAFLLINLAQNPEVQRELREEVLSRKGDESAYIQQTDTLLEYTCMESTRLCPAAWFTLPEYSTVDIDIGGYRIKAGTSCIIDWARLNTESPIWQSVKGQPGVGGKSFYPQRFRTMSPLEYRWSMLRFGFGSRQCIGYHFGVSMMKCFLLKVLSTYELESVGATSTKAYGSIGVKVDLREDRFTVSPKQNVKFTRL